MLKIGKNTLFTHIFLNMDIWLIMNSTGMKIAIPVHVAETRLEGRVSQNFDIGLNFCFILSVIFLENILKYQNDHSGKFGGAILPQ